MSDTILDTPDAIAFFHYASLKGAIKLEAIGMKHSSGRSALSIAKQRLGLSKGTKREAVLAALEGKLTELKESNHARA